MTKKTAICLWRLAKTAIMNMMIYRCSDPKNLCIEGSYVLLNDNGSHKKKSTGCPRGHVPVLVGDEGKRYFVPIAYLSHQVFTFLLERTRADFGYKHDCEGCIIVMCDVEVFEHLIHLIRNNPTSQSMDAVIQDVLDQLDSMECPGPQIIE